VRFARNQSLYREVNEQVAALTDPARFPRMRIVCECANVDCVEQFDVTVEEYEAVRSRPVRFLVLAGHVFPEVEEVVAEAGVYVVVAKVEEGAATAAALDPRAT
jgi:hypothetical protein